MSDEDIDFGLNVRRITSYALAAVILGGVLGFGMWRFGGVYVPSLSGIKPTSLQRFSSYEELKDYLSTPPDSQNGGIGIPVFWGMTRSLAIEDSAEKSAGGDYSQTNIQVEGVDEADLVKTDGDFIYLASGSSVIIIKAFPPEDAVVVARLESEKQVGDLFINGDKLIVFYISGYGDWFYEERIASPEYYQEATEVKIFDVSDRSNPSLDRTFSADGSYFNSRMIGDYVYVIVRENAILEDGEVELPVIRTDSGEKEIEASSIYYPNSTDYNHAFTSVIAINVQDPEEEVNHETYLLGYACTMYVSQKNIYITSPRWAEDKGEYFEGTTVHKIEIEGSEINYLTDGFVPGHVLNQFSMDEYDGNFRIATTVGRASRTSSQSVSNVYVLGPEMDVVGSIEGLAPGEEIYSARFMGRRCYLVTFRKIDPLFVIDLGNPEEPKVLGKLKIPGYSDYLHPYDENHLIGIGKETIGAEEGDFAWYRGVKISLFDVSDVANPKEVAKYEIGDRGTDSQALRDHKAFLFDRRRNLLVIPALVAEIDSSDYGNEVPPHAHGEFVYQGAHVFDISPAGISLRGRITHLDDDWDLKRSGYIFESKLTVERALYIDDVLYTISQGMVKMNDLEDLGELNKVELF
jgi:uncharacterized secreted protein with C-terminal beta-propeller domain